MVECGIVKWFDGRPNKLFGFADVLDANGQTTGEIWFHLYDEHSAHDERFTQHIVPVIPDLGARIVFERKSGRDGRPKAFPWALETKWSQRSWRLIQKVQVMTGIIEFAGTVDDTYREEEGSIVILSGLTSEPIENVQRWTSAKLEFYYSVASDHEYGYDSFVYYLQILQDGKWVDVKTLRPVQDPPLCEYCNDGGCDACCPPEDNPCPDDDEVTYATIYSRAFARTGSHEQACEAATHYPGDYK